MATSTTALPPGSTNVSGLAPWAQDYITDYLGKSQALSGMGYQVYQGPQTAGFAPLQQAGFRGIANLAVPQALMQGGEYLNQIAQNLGNVAYQPVGVSFTGKDIPTRANMPLTQGAVSKLEGTLGAPIGAGEYLPWGGFEQKTAATTTTPISELNNLYQQYFGKAGDAEGMAYWQNKFGKEIDANELSEFIRAGIGAIKNTPAPAVTTPISELNNLYQQYFGKAGDAEGMAYWQNKFGKEIDENELDEFIKAGIGALKGGTTTTATTKPISELNNLYQKYFGKDGDAEGMAYWQNKFGEEIDQDELDQFISAGIGALKGGTTTTGTGTGTDTGTTTKTGVNKNVTDLYQQYLGKDPDLEGGKYWSDRFGSEVDNTELLSFLQSAQTVLEGQGKEVPKSITDKIAELTSAPDKSGFNTERVRRYADGGAVSSGVTTSGGMGSLAGNTDQSTYKPAIYTSNASNVLGGVNATTPQASQPVSSYAEQYMNPYLQASLTPQYEELRRQSQINLQPTLSKLAQAGAFGGGRQAIIESEAQRNLLQAQQNLLGQGYKTAFDEAQQQFNTEQQRAIQEAQYGADYGLRAAQQQTQAAQAMGQLGQAQNQAQLANLNLALTGGGIQRDVAQQGTTADYNEFLRQVQYPYQQLQFQRDMLSGLPVSTIQNQPAQLSGIASLISVLGGTSNLANSLANPNIQNLLKNLGLGNIFSSSDSGTN